jgi:hypothetical protein
MDASLESPVRPPGLSDERLAQMRAHLLDEVDRDARKRERRAHLRSRARGRRRAVLVVVAAALAVAYSVPAVAQESWWWVTSPDDPARPATQVVSIGPWSVKELLITDPNAKTAPTASVTTGGGRWAVQAYVSKEQGLCLGHFREPLTRDAEGGIGCGFPVRGRGLAPPGIPSEKLHWVGYVAGIPGKVTATSPKFVFGPAAPNVHSVDLENNYEGRTIRVRTQPLPDSLGVDARFWIVVLAPHELVHTIVPRDKDGSALEHWRLPMAV